MCGFEPFWWPLPQPLLRPQPKHRSQSGSPSLSAPLPCTWTPKAPWRGPAGCPTSGAKWSRPLLFHPQPPKGPGTREDGWVYFKLKIEGCSLTTATTRSPPALGCQSWCPELETSGTPSPVACHGKEATAKCGLMHLVALACGRLSLTGCPGRVSTGRQRPARGTPSSLDL